MSVEMLEAPAAETFVASIVREARGNPFLLEQLARYALSSDKATTTGITLAVMLEARLRLLPKGSRQFLNTLAVAARPVNPEVAYKAAGLKGDELRLIGALRLAQLLRSGGSNYGVELYHDRIREVVLNQIQRPRGGQLHHQIAQALEGREDADPDEGYYPARLSLPPSHESIVPTFDQAGWPQRTPRTQRRLL